MAVLNKCIFSGVVTKEPKFTSDGEMIFSILINRKDISRQEEITLLIKNKETYKKAIKKLKKGNYFITTNSHLETRNVERVKEIICPHCSDVFLYKYHGENLEIVVDDFVVYPEFTVKNKELEGINKVFLMGVVCSDINSKKAINSVEYAKFKIYLYNYDYIKDVKDFTYPYVVCFKHEKDKAMKKLKKGDIIFLEGSIQQRTFKQIKENNLCKSCNNMFNHSNYQTIKEVIILKSKYMMFTQDDFKYIIKEENEE